MSDEAKAPAKQEQAPEPEAWRNVAEVKSIISDRDQAKKEARELRERLSTFEKAEADREAERVARRDAEERKKLSEAGQFEEIIKRNDEKYKSELKARGDRYAQKMVPLFIKAAATSLGNVTPEALEDLPVLLRDKIGFDENGDAFVIKDGVMLRGDDGKPYPPEKFIAEMVKGRTYMLRDTMPVSHGAQAGGKVESAPRDIAGMMAVNDTAGLAKWATEDQEGYREAMRAYSKSLVQGNQKFLKDRKKP